MDSTHRSTRPSQDCHSLWPTGLSGLSHRAICTRSATASRILAVRTQAEFEILQDARQHQQTEMFRARYAQRSGIEGTHSQAVRSLGLLKTALSHLSPATAINLIRLDAFLEGKKVAKTRVSRFAALGPVELAG